MKFYSLSFLVATLVLAPQVTGAQTPGSPASLHLCADSVFKFQTNFWVNLHLFLRGESRRRAMSAAQEMPVTSLLPDERAAWEGSLAAYEGMAKVSLFDDGLVKLNNT